MYIGISAGVGKNCHLLTETRSLQRNGIDVKIGYVETHKGKETGALVEGLFVIPLGLKLEIISCLLIAMRYLSFKAECHGLQSAAVILLCLLEHTHPKKRIYLRQILFQGTCCYIMWNHRSKPGMTFYPF